MFHLHRWSTVPLPQSSEWKAAFIQLGYETVHCVQAGDQIIPSKQFDREKMHCLEKLMKEIRAYLGIQPCLLLSSLSGCCQGMMRTSFLRGARIRVPPLVIQSVTAHGPCQHIKSRCIWLYFRPGGVAAWLQALSGSDAYVWENWSLILRGEWLESPWCRGKETPGSEVITVMLKWAVSTWSSLDASKFIPPLRSREWYITYIFS